MLGGIDRFGYGYGFFWDPTYFLVLIGVIICSIASAKVRSTYNRYNRVRSSSGMTGAQAAERILRAAGITDVSIRHVSGSLSDHYDPRTKTVNLSDTVYGSQSVAAIGVAAHECGHVMQHAHGYFPLTFRSALVPVANIGSTLAWPMILIGLFFSGKSSSLFIQFGILLFSLAVLFQLVTLPVEFNASRRALASVEQLGLLSSDEIPKTRRVLSAAALTYVASAAAAILQLLRLILLFGGRDRD